MSSPRSNWTDPRSYVVNGLDFADNEFSTIGELEVE